MENERERTVAGIGDGAVREKTGRGWDEWLEALDEEGASEMEHAAIAALLREEHGLPAWWSQMVAVGYERERGLREKHETADGFSISKTRTVGVPVSALFGAWLSEEARRPWLDDPDFRISSARPEKSIRADWVDGETRLELLFTAKGPEKSSVTVEHSRLPDADAAARMKEYWGGALDRLQETLEG